MISSVIIGRGYWGSILQGYIQASEQFELYGVCGSELTDAKLDKLAISKHVQAFFICTPFQTHYEYCRTLLQAGKYVFCEKPTVPSMEQYRELESLGGVLYTDYIYLCSPSLAALKKELPALGPINFVKCEIGQYGKFYKNENVFSTLGVHMAAAVLYLLECLPEQAQFDYCVDRHYGILTMAFPDGPKILIEANLLCEHRARSITAYGQNGMLKLDYLAEDTLQQWKYTQDGQLTHWNKWTFDEKHNLQRALEDFYDCIHTSDHPNRTYSRWIMELFAGQFHGSYYDN